MSMKKLDIREIEPFVRDLSSWAAMARLIEDLGQGTVMPFLGAGVSQAIGFPGWTEAVLRLGQVADQRITGLTGEQITKLQGDALSLADRFREAIPDQQQYHQFFRKQFACTDVTRDRVRKSNLWQALAYLPCRDWITLNYDCALEFALNELAGRRSVSVNWTDRPNVNQFLLGEGGVDEARCVHLHGLVPLDAGSPGDGDFVLTEQEYQQRYLRSDEDRSKLFVIFTSRVMLFIGCSLTDLDLMGVLREVKAKLGYRGHRHYAILAEPRDDRERDERNRERLRMKYGVEPIFYRNDDDHFAGLPALLRFLRAAVEIQPAALPLPQAIESTIDNDPQKGRWGMTPVRDRYRISFGFQREEGAWCHLTLTVSGPGSRARFHMHPTFKEGPFERPFKAGQAELRCKAWGVFTVGVEVFDDGSEPMWLELDLAECEELPYDFRQL